MADIDNDYYLDNDEQTVVIIMTSGPSTPGRCATPFYLGAVMASMDVDVHIFFTMEGVRLMEQGVTDDLRAMEDGKLIKDFIQDAKRAGVRLHVNQLEVRSANQTCTAVKQYVPRGLKRGGLPYPLRGYPDR